MYITSSLKEYCFLVVAYSVQIEFTPSQSIVYLFQILEQDLKRQITRLNLGLFNSHWNSWGRRHKKLSPGNLLKNYSFFSLLVQFKTRRISFLKMISEIDRGNHSFFSWLCHFFQTSLFVEKVEERNAQKNQWSK